MEVKKTILYGESLNRYGSWAVCFTYGTWFGVNGLVAGGKTYQNSSSLRKASDFLLSKQLDSGGWGESYLSCQDKVNFSMNTLKGVFTSCFFHWPFNKFFLNYFFNDYLWVVFCFSNWHINVLFRVLFAFCICCCTNNNNYFS